jgi:hypothetical protein
LIFLFASGYLGSQATRYSFGPNQWKRDTDGAYQQFVESEKKIFFEIAGEKYKGVVHASGYYRLEGNSFFSRLTDAWVDTGHGGGASAGKLSAQAEAELGFTREEKRKLTWIDANTFKLSENWFSAKGETWRRQDEVTGDQAHYTAAHNVPEHWVDGRGWVPDKSDKKPATTAPSDAAADQEALGAAAVSWLRLVDAGDYRGSFDAAAEQFRKGLTAEQWGTTLSTMKKEYGQLISRSDNVNLKTKTSESDGGAPKVTYVLKIQTTFARTQGTEAITMTKESGHWKVADYSVEVTKTR